MVNMLQNVSNGKKLIKTDMVSACSAAYLTVYPGISRYATAKFRLPLGHFPHAWVYYVKGEGNGKASVVWLAVIYFSIPGTDYEISYKSHGGSSMQFLQNVPAEQIHKNLKINAGENKIITECCLCYATGATNYYFSDGRQCAGVSPREAFGFQIIAPQSHSYSGQSNYFSSVVIFTPKPGLFDETPPK